MAKLTEEMVVARSKQSDLSAVKKLNCWGAELGDVSLLRQMPNVEVLAFSLNKIRSLVDFAWCERLRELYVRKNDIHDLREIRYLRRLPALTSLWLDENPCTEHPEYRMTVLRNLPHLERLDNLPVHPDEVAEAQSRGAHIPDSDDEDQSQELDDQPEQEWRQPSPEYEPPTSTRDDDSDRQEHREVSTAGRECRDSYPERRESSNGVRESSNGGRELSTGGRENVAEHREPMEYRGVERREPEWTERRESRDTDEWRENDRREPEYVDRRESNDRRESIDRRDMDRREVGQPCRAASAMTRSYYGTPSSQRSDPPLRHSSSAHNVHGHSHGHHGHGHGQTDGEPEGRMDTRDRLLDSSRCGCACVRPDWRGRRPTARSSNLLSAVLCLVKELDYPALEVLELAVRCRMDELAASSQ